MSNISPSLRQRVRDAVAAATKNAGNLQLAASINKLTAQTLSAWGAMTPSRGAGELGLESLGEAVPTRVDGFDVERDTDVNELVQGLVKLGMPERHLESTVESCMRLLDKSYSAGNVIRPAQMTGDNQIDLAQVVGRSSVFDVTNEDTVGLEAFGSDINRLPTDDRLTMSLNIMRPWENIMDKGFARVNDSSAVVVIRAPQPAVYDWAAGQKSGATLAERHAEQPLRNLYRDPSMVNTQAKKIVPVSANDAGNVLFSNSNGVFYYKTGVKVDSIGLTLDAAKFGFGMADRTDIVSDGAILDNILVTVVSPADSNDTDTFLLNTRAFALAMFTAVPSNRTSGQRQVNMEVTLPITSTTKDYVGATSSIAAHLTDAKMMVKVQVNANLNLQTGELSASGSVTPVLVGIGSGTPSGATQTFFGQLKISFSGFSVDSYFNEENQRKANLAVWCQYSEKQFHIPRSRVFFTEYSALQDVDENAITTTSTVVALGNGRRGLDILVNRLKDVGDSAAFMASNPEVAASNLVDEQSLVSSLVKPTVIKTTLDFSIAGNEEFAIMNESTRLSEIHGRFRARILAMAAVAMSDSQMLNQYKGGETPVFKIYTHSVQADLVIGILDYHPQLDDKLPNATGADYSMRLPNGYRIDVIKSNMDCLKGRLYGVPVIESDMASPLSAGSIRDAGSATINYSPTNAGAVTRRVATTTREILMMSNPVGFVMEITGLEDQIGGVDFGGLALNSNKVDAIVL